MADTRGVFSIIEVVTEKLENNWVPLEDVWIAPSPFYAAASNTGYFGGGNAGPSLVFNSVEKINYTSGTITLIPTAILSIERDGAGAVSSPIAGYFAGGSTYPTPSPNSTVDKLIYASDITVAVPSASLGSPFSPNTATGNLISGYVSCSPGSSRITYSTDTRATVPALVTTGYYGGTGNLTAGYYAGIPGSTQARKVTYASETYAIIPGLSSPRYSIGAAGNSTSGYFGGGTPGPSPNTVATVDKCTYATDTFAVSPTAAFSIPRLGISGTGNQTDGYFAGSGGSGSTFVEKITYSTDTRSAFPGRLRTGRSMSAALSAVANELDTTSLIYRSAVESPSKRYIDGVSQSLNNGYFGLGLEGTPSTSFTTSRLDKISYSTDTRILLSSTFSNPLRAAVAATGNSTAGYFGGGYTIAPGQTARLEKITYSTDVVSPSPTLSIARRYIAATGNQTAGYFGGGYSFPSPSVQVSKITYSSETSALSPTANLTIAREGLAATGNQAAGYFGSGSSGTEMDKLTYSTDTTVAVPGANLSVGRYRLAATGNTTNGYFGGGSTGSPIATMDKVTYASDTTVATPTANLTIARYSLAATGNSTAGYFGGGAGTTRMDKVTYVTDTTAVAPGASLATPRYNHAATGTRENALPRIDPPASTPTPEAQYLLPTPNAGYFGGGTTGTPKSAIMNKVTYSTDTISSVPGAALRVARNNLAATGSSTAGYFSGGDISASVTIISTTDKVTYSTDTTAVSPTTSLLNEVYAHVATGNSINGYFAGGVVPGFGGSLGVIHKLNFATESSGSIPGALSIDRKRLGATGNSTHGYFGGGGDPTMSKMDRITYSTDTIVAVPSANLTVNRQRLAATGNSTHGYFGGGDESLSSTEKVTYSSNTTAVVPGAALSLPRGGLAATGNSTAGYFIGGGQVNASSIADKIIYSTDTKVAVSGVSRWELAASSARANDLPQPTYNAPGPNLV